MEAIVGGVGQARIRLAGFIGLRQTEVEDLHPSLGCQHHIGRFQIPMNHALLVCCIQRLGDLFRNRQGLIHQNRTAPKARLQRLAFHQLHDDATRLAQFLEAIDVGNVGVIERRPHTLPTSTTRRNTSRSLDHTILSRVSGLLCLGRGISKADCTSSWCFPMEVDR
jgi:hypothetical protein